MGELVDRDQEHLKLLKWGFYLMAGMAAFVTLFSLLYVGVASLIAVGGLPDAPSRGIDPRIVGAMFFGFSMVFFLISLSGTLLTFFAGRWLAERRRRIFCMVMAGLWCLSIPFGTAIGICAILVLQRPSVQALFDVQDAPPASPSPPSNAA
jgi:hypothetical protein